MPMMAKGAQRVSAQERPADATRRVAPAMEVTKKVANMARAKIRCPQVHARGILNRAMRERKSEA